MNDDELLVVRTLRLKGRADLATLTAVTGVDSAPVIVASLVESGAAREVRGHWMLSGSGTELLDGLLEEERAGLDHAAVAEIYEQFVAVNGEFKAIASDWQMRGSDLNDHQDVAYDARVLARFADFHERAIGLVTRATGLVSRLAIYGPRLQRAREKVRGGDTAWFLKPLIDSYHTVWFELHEELIGLAGLSRGSEAASGRAE